MTHGAVGRERDAISIRGLHGIAPARGGRTSGRGADERIESAGFGRRSGHEEMDVPLQEDAEEWPEAVEEAEGGRPIFGAAARGGA